ncbi:Elongator subunit elp2 [Friedmanniomyces endolithicus]|uniref:Elongator complex protein 2 n=1 Tax=Friedmanniomyces endolithicus TaxID=329885 RepID=A0AAN6KYH3_9PEZI|nr:Elongator subunit elp2 [Friedmanniomyces endolithicus]KAK0277688.1 Elongator subunit elp2 [Friedmanniomyces endolithicus]KAK0318266.1 Elongator subunit elp2 [Friedmanniomyces endolithicus]KAK0930854.1 Elongator subunit elp2 [Friedmanniomyces endolithicus]KAK0982029.1 Elongator subunit elp2 [Friedmanniomyces endolithicus]
MEDTPTVSLSYIAAGGNRHPSAADWAPGLLAFGAGNNIALWNPEDDRQNGISALLAGHTDAVNVVKTCDYDGQQLIISGGADKTVRVWRPTLQSSSPAPYEQSCCLVDHQSSVNTISVLPDLHLFVSGSADSTIKVWTLGENLGAKLIQSISLQPRYLPLTTALATLSEDAVVLAVAGTSSSIQLYVRPKADADFVLQATLAGHEGWIRSLDFVQDGDGFLLASASQDKYIRLWRLRQDPPMSPSSSTNTTPSTDSSAIPKQSLSNKPHQLITPSITYTLTFEALLTGHEDWIYTALWAPRTSTTKPTTSTTSTKQAPPTLLSASADNSLALWTADPTTGVWLCTTRLGDIATQKGSTTATGSTGGFWTGLWQPPDERGRRGVVSLGRTGSWRKWNFDDVKGMWEQRVGTSGHTREVRGLAWAGEEEYLLSTGADQTTRLFGEWKREEGVRSWHEFARPQIHGYDLNCIAAVGKNRFVSGADEKLLRVFDKPRAFDALLSRLSGTRLTVAGGLAEAAEIPVLGLSNKAIPAATPNDDGNEQINGALDDNPTDPSSTTHASTFGPTHPPLEDHLSRHTLWPEHEKLYGHGHEISALACNPSGSLIATACKASSLEHAVIRLYETKEWREVRLPLEGHSLTVTGLAFAPLSAGEEGEGEWLVSVGRDRRWCVFCRRREGEEWGLVCWREKAHARMILDCCWGPARGVGERVFATAGRDRCVKVWRLEGEKGECMLTVSLAATGTAVAFSSVVRGGGLLRLAVGMEDGGIQLLAVDLDGEASYRCLEVPRAWCPSGAVTCLRWRPSNGEREGEGEELAVASEDHSVRILEIKE